MIWSVMKYNSLYCFFLAISCALVGCFLVLRKMVMLTNALSHTILLGIILSFVLLKVPSIEEMNLSFLLIASLLTAIITASLTYLLHKVFHVQEDASIGISFTFLFALGVFLATILTRNVHVGIEAVMGNADALQITDLKSTFYILVLNFFIIVLFYRGYVVSSFDGFLAKNLGFYPVLLEILFLFQVSWTSIAGFRSVGVILVLEFFICPFILARKFCNRMVFLLLSSCGISCFLCFISLALSRHLLTCYGLAFSTASIVAVFMGLCVAVLLYFDKKKVFLS